MKKKLNKMKNKMAKKLKMNNGRIDEWTSDQIEKVEEEVKEK